MNCKPVSIDTKGWELRDNDKNHCTAAERYTTVHTIAMRTINANKWVQYKHNVWNYDAVWIITAIMIRARRHM